MATAFLPFAHLFEAIQGLVHWFAPRPAPVRSLPAQPAPRIAKPLRVVRVVEACAAPAPCRPRLRSTISRRPSASPSRRSGASVVTARRRSGRWSTA